MAELADALDSGSSGHCARAGSSPVIRSFADKTIDRNVGGFSLFGIKKDSFSAENKYLKKINIF